MAVTTAAAFLWNIFTGASCASRTTPKTVHWSDEETDNSPVADDRNYYKVEKWTKDGAKVDRMLYAGSSFAKAQEVFASAVKHRPRIRLTIRQRTRALHGWPRK
jgi:hypothetical protein